MLILFQALIGLFVGYSIYHFYCLYCNIRIARTSGLPYIVIPIFEYGIFWMVFCPLLHPLINRCLPSFLTKSWEPFLAPDWQWRMKHSACKLLKSDVFLVVSPTAIIMSVADADMINEIITRREDFPKPTKAYRALDIFGKNVVTTTGKIWRVNRKITAPSFNEKNNQLVWTETVEKTKALLDHWVTPIAPSMEPPDIRTLSDDCMRLAFHVISWAGFRLKLTWPKRVSGKSFDELPSPDKTIEQGHSMSFQSALHYVLVWIFLLVGAPKLYMQSTPYKPHRTAWKAFKEWGVYMNEMIAERKRELENGMVETGDIMGALVGAYYSGVEEKGEKEKPMITKQEVIGNTFIMMLAGHETTARTLHYTIMMLAVHPELQKPLQEEISRILGDREPDYERDFQPLASGWCGAIMNETLRVFCPVVVTIVYNKKKCIIPADTVIHINNHAVHRNPKYWVLPNQTEEEAQINEYRPQRWFLNNNNDNSNSSSSTSITENYDEEDDTNPAYEPQGKDTSKSFFRPHRGSYMPFSDGPRACLGRKFAQVEFVAALAVLFREYCVELVVRKGETWEEARGRARRYVDNSGAVITLGPKGEEVGVRFVRRV
ncbi:cytochrome P450 [Kalaharituber pfeilii]|nr:cytochrome P450 [Kalaharituber pfeilii]